MLLFIDIVTAIHSLVLFIRNYTLPADLAGWFGSATAVAFNISDITKFLNYDKSSCIWQLIKGKLGESQTLLKSFNGIATFLYNMLSADGVLSLLLVSCLLLLYTKKLLFLSFHYLSCNHSNLISIIIHLIFIIIPQISWCYRTIRMTISRSSVLSINVLLIFYLHNLSGELFLKACFLFLLLPVIVPVTVILPLTIIHTSL